MAVGAGERSRELRPTLSMRSSSEGYEHLTAESNDPNAEMSARAAQRCQEMLHSDEQLRNQANRSLLKKIGSQKTTIELVATAFELYAERPMFATWDDKEGTFKTTTYGELWDKIVALASDWTAHGLKPGDFVGICGFASSDWWLCDLACLYSGAVRVPLPTNIIAEDLQKIINEAELRVLCCSKDELSAVGSIISGCPTVKAFLLMDTDHGMPTKAAIRQLEDNLPAGCKDVLLVDSIAAGRHAPEAKMMVPGKDGHEKDPLVGLMYTSGSTGLPKGAMFTDSIWLQYWQWAANDPNPLPRVNLGFLPLNHLVGQLQLFRAATVGGSVYWLRNPDMSTFFEDLALVRPTDMMLIPRFANMIYDRFQNDLEKIGGGSEDEVARKRQELIVHFREKVMGGRMLQATTGSAPTAPEVINFLRDTLLIPIHETYGSTESGLMTANNVIGPRVTAWKLDDVPELGYLTSDRPFPRGELLIKTTYTIPGYYKHPKESAELFKDGFLCTGDIMEQREANCLAWIDRRKNIMKLAQGEFVSVSRLEQDYVGSSALIHQMFIYGSGLRSYLLAVVVPSEEAKALGDEAVVKARLRTEIDNTARRKKLQGYEIPRDFIVEYEAFSKVNHLLTDSSKPARGKLKAKYQEVLEGMYKAAEDRQKERRSAMRQASGSGSVADKIKQAAEVTLGLEAADLAGGESSFAQLGGDSLAAIQFTREVNEVCAVELPVSFVLDHSHSLAAIIAKVESLLAGGDEGTITFESIHGKYPERGGVIKAADLDLHRFIPDVQLAEWKDAQPAESLPEHPTVVLLTGANGFLGRFLLLDLLQRVAKREGGRVVAIVRGKSDDAARARLRAGYDSGDAKLLAAYDKLSATHLSVYSGDLAKPNLGLTPEVYARLAEKVDTIVHNGALVNHAFTYEQLFEPNVLGSLEVMKLALQRRRKAVTFLSTVGVAAGVPHEGPITEEEFGTRLCTEHLGGPEGYAMGYGCTKWATEVQLRQLHEEFNVPVSIFRCGMILAHSSYVGQINTTDFFTRLMASLVYTGIAPGSFYVPDCPEKHFDGMPIDFVSTAICGVLAAHRSGFIMNHVVNPHWDDGISLDRIEEWMVTGGARIERIPDHDEWFQRFSAALEKLDSQRRQFSALPLIHMWAKPMPAEQTKLDASKFRQRTRQTTSYEDVPHLSEAFIHTNLRHMKALHVID